MAAPTALTRKHIGRAGIDPNSNIRMDLVTQVNNLTASLRLLTAKLDADGGVTDTTYDSLITESAIATAPVVITVDAGL